MKKFSILQVGIGLILTTIVTKGTDLYVQTPSFRRALPEQVDKSLSIVAKRKDMDVQISSSNRVGEVDKSTSRYFLHTYELAGDVFNFWDGEDGIICEVTDTTGDTRELSMPKEFRNSLNRQPREIRERVLSECWYVKLGTRVSVRVRALGGWDVPQHKGYIDLGCKTYPNLLPDKGTFSFVKEVFQYTMKKANLTSLARLIADACMAVDEDERNSTVYFDTYAQSWHFNTNPKSLGGTSGDSRFQHVLVCLILANWDPETDLSQYPKLYKEFKKISHGRKPGDKSFLGDALHALQDAFAHWDIDVHMYQPFDDGINAGKPFYGHMLLWDYDKPLGLENVNIVGSLAVDNPYHIDTYSRLSLVKADKRYGLSQRYSDMETASLLLLYIDQLLKDPIEMAQMLSPIQDTILKRLHQSLPQETDLDLSLRGTHAILGFINTLWENPFFTDVKEYLANFREPLVAVYGDNKKGLSEVVPNPHGSPIKVTLLMDALIDLQIQINGKKSKSVKQHHGKKLEVTEKIPTLEELDKVIGDPLMVYQHIAEQSIDLTKQ